MPFNLTSSVAGSHMKINNILKKFKLTDISQIESIYPYSPVYKIHKNNHDYVLKQTCSNIDDANRLASYLSNLNNKKINIVTPISVVTPNPQEINNDVWVLYPFIKGSKYSASTHEIIEAGRLLGKIHSISSINNQEKLSEYNEYELEDSDIINDINIIHDHCIKHKLAIDINQFKRLMLETIENQSVLRKYNLPAVATPYDYKADNLIYLECNQAFIIDPDNATYIPRIFDLALTLLLFHNVLETAPNRIFTVDEWELFKLGYSEFITVTPFEKSCWQQAIKHLFLDEVIWLMSDFEQGWENTRQRNLFISLLSLILDEKLLKKYTL